MSENKNIDIHPEKDQVDVDIIDIAESPGETSNVGGSVKNVKQHTSTSERQIKFERAQKCLENAALVSKRIKEHRKAAAELLGKPFDDDVGDTASEMATTMSERTGYSVATEKSTLSVQDALNIPGISESLANTLKQKELLMERIKQYKEISKRPAKTSAVVSKKESTKTSVPTTDVKKQTADNVDVAKLINTVKEKENALSVIQVKMRAMETTILDLQEKINEKDQIIEAKNKATTLISDNLSKKEKDTIDLLEDTRQQMTKMQNNFATMELEWKEERNRLVKQIDEKSYKINSLEEANTILENSRFEISLAHSKLAEELNLKNEEIIELNKKINLLENTNIQESQKVADKEHSEEEKGTLEIAGMVELTKKIEMLEQLNFQIRQTNKDLENQLAVVNLESKASASNSSKKGSPVTNRKGGKSTKSKSPWSNLTQETAQETDKKMPKNENVKLEMMLQSLNKDILEKEYLISQKESLVSQLESSITEKDATILELRSLVDAQKMPKIELVDNATDCVDLSQSDTSSKQVTDISTESTATPTDIKNLEEKLQMAENKIQALNDEIEASNKNMIKVKSQSKLKLKQLQKTIDNFSKVSDANAEIVKLNEELHQLSQKVAELEEEKGNLQLHLVDYDSGRLTESDVFKKLVEIENLAEARLKSISLLESQKFDLVQELHILQQKNMELEDKLADVSQLQNEQVCSEIKSVQLEEQIDELIASKKELELVTENLKFDKEQLLGSIEVLQREKEELLHKLESYIQENLELTDKLEKLSAEKVSSAESIEIVESLTTQEKLELEEYNKSVDGKKKRSEELHQSYQSELHHSNENIETLVKQSAELNEKVELFTNERQEVMDKMNALSLENESLHEKIEEHKKQCESLRDNINELTEEKINLETLNHQLNQQIEELKNERFEIMKETVEIVKPLNLDENVENLLTESHDEKSAGDKTNNRSKSVKQLTKDILKLKSVIKEREAEIADCQMKILSLEEHQDKQKEVIQNIAINDEKIKQLMDENMQLKYEMEKVNKSEQDRAQINVEHLQDEIQRLSQEYSVAITNRDSRIHELENLLKDYEMQILNYNNTLQQKDKEISDFINQITKLNDVSQKLKSTIDLLEEEKAKDQNVEIIKSLNKQISIYQKTLSDYEDKLKTLDEEKNQLASLKLMYENNSNSLESEIKNMKDRVNEKETTINELKAQHQKHLDELSAVKVQAKEQDEEIHEIKLQLRKESIENEKLRTVLQEKDETLAVVTNNCEDIKKQLETASVDHKSTNEKCEIMENKNKELMEKLKKFAVTIKKKAAMYTELESQFNELQNGTALKNQQIEHLLIQVESIPLLQDKIKQAEEQSHVITNEKTMLLEELKKTKDQYLEKSQEAIKLDKSLDALNKELGFVKQENSNIKNQNEFYSKKMAEFEIDQKNNSNFLTKIACLEAEILKKQSYIEQLCNELQEQKDILNQIQLGHGAKIHECELYIENLLAEIEKYKQRISRLEEAVSMLEYGRVSMERKAVQLDNQLLEKQRAYRQYSEQEDELVSRLAYLLDNDRLIAKQLDEIDMENQDLQLKIQYLNEEYTELQNSYSDIQDYCKILEFKANKVDELEAEVASNHSKIKEFEANMKRLSVENNSLLEKKKTEIEELEMEFNTQIHHAIKEKKQLSEKCEKLCEREIQLELQIQEYHTNMENLKVNVKDLCSENERLVEKAGMNIKELQPDYTDQYISEINNLNSVINSKNEEIIELSNKIQIIQKNHAKALKTLENKVTELNDQLKHSSVQVDKYVDDINLLKHCNEDLSGKLQQKDDQIKQLMEKKKLFFEMNIPKTEGLTISSTIEDISDEGKTFNISELQSQIVSDIGVDSIDSTPAKKKTLDDLQSQSDCVLNITKEGDVEPPMISKKSYLCYDKDESVSEQFDPFHSEEGWGMDTNEECVDVTPGLSHLNATIQKLNEENQKLKSDLENTSTKLLKALKKLKELKTSNDILTNELNISKQISQASMLDMAIESEMSNNLEELEKKIEALNLDITKEKREKEAIKKQNEVLKNANDRLIEMKEKLDNEIELWKYNFKQANDKLSSFHWGAEATDNSTNIVNPSTPYSIKNVETKDDIVKLEKENDELQALVDDLNQQNRDLSKQLQRLKDEFTNLQREYENRSMVCEECEKYKIQIQNLLDSNKDLNENKISLIKQIQDVQIQNEEALRNLNKLESNSLENEKVSAQNQEDFVQKNLCLQKTIESQNEKMNCLLNELEDVKFKMVNAEEKLKYQTKNPPKINVVSFEDKSLKDRLNTLENELKKANKKIEMLETNNQELIQKTKLYEAEINEFNVKLQNLNTENDQLLSTVAELRASISTAVDQRGYEIAELWKQHLAQREGEFQKIEQDLRTELNVSESKYEQLLDKMQNSNREETEKMIIVEQVASLQKKIQEKEENLINLQNKYTDVVHQLQTLHSEMDDEKLMLENKMLSQQDEYENIIQEMKMQNQKFSEDLVIAIKNHESELLNNQTLNQQIAEQRKTFEVKINDLTKQIQIKDSEIYHKSQEFANVLAQKTDEFEFVTSKLLEYEKKIEDLGFEKESELAVLRLKMHDTVNSYEHDKATLEDEKKKMAESLNNKIIECTSLNKTITDLKKSLEEYSVKIAEAQAVLENQEIEIVALKEEISSLNDMIRTSASKVDKHVTFASDKLSVLGRTESTLNKELLDAVPRAELDLALYMLHQRDVRCEELTMELTQLLEERDTLQLRLSDSLRSIEEFKIKNTGLDISDQNLISDLPSTSSEKENQSGDTQRPSRSSSLSDPDTDKPNLHAKLSELRSVKHSRDVRLRHESEQRQLGMRLLHRDVANLPPEAVDQLTQAHHTLTRDSQSTPTVLLNWLRGKSTPKVVHM